MADLGDEQQLALVGGKRARKSRRSTTKRPAAHKPVARVLVDIAIPHLDHPFDYLVPEKVADDAVAGARVRVTFAGADHDGYILERLDRTDHGGRLAYLKRVVSPEPVLTSEVALLAREVADRYAGTMSDVVRLAVPPRHAATEKKPSPRGVAPASPEIGAWATYRHGEPFLDAMRRGSSPRAVWNPAPSEDWAELLARVAATAAAHDRGVIIVVPDGGDVARIDRALTGLIGNDHHVCLEAGVGAAERYRRWLAVLRGSVRIVVGTRAAAFAPVHDLGLVCMWDDGDDVHAEPRAPYPHMREVLLLRAWLADAAALIGGFARTTEAERLVQLGWARSLTPPREVARSNGPRVRTVGDDYEQNRDEAARNSRVPSLAWRVAKAGLKAGPVLVHVPRAGYVPRLACDRCRTPAQCQAPRVLSHLALAEAQIASGGVVEKPEYGSILRPSSAVPETIWITRQASRNSEREALTCSGPLTLRKPNGRLAVCGWCAQATSDWRCQECGHHTFRAITVGVARTAEEIGKAFPGVQVLTSWGETVRHSVADEHILVVATPGAEPIARHGYAAALLLDGNTMLNRPALRASEEALRRWLHAASLVRSRADGGEIVIVADPSARAVQALVRFDPVGFAVRELEERHELMLPPTSRLAEITGAESDVLDVLRSVRLSEAAEVSGPVPHDDQEVKAVIRVPREAGAELSKPLKDVIISRSLHAKKTSGRVRIRIDPWHLA